jgi:hypothetical protein
MEGERNLVFETSRQPRRGQGAVIVYLTERDRGATMELWRQLTLSDRERLLVERKRRAVLSYPDHENEADYWCLRDIPEWGENSYAPVISRLVNGEQVWSAWFPMLLVGTYRVGFKDQFDDSRWLTVFEGEVTEVDWRD